MRRPAIKTAVLILCILMYAAVMYGLHFVLDNAGSDIGTAARVVHRMGVEPAFIFSIEPSGLDANMAGAGNSDRLMYDTYVVGPKFVLYSLASVSYRLLDLLFSRTDPLSALYLTSLFCLLGSVALIYAIASRVGSAPGRTYYMLVPVLVLSMPSVYYLVHDPSYPLVTTLFLLGGIYQVMRAYTAEPRGYTLMMLASGVTFGLTLGVGSQGPLIIFAGVVYTGISALLGRRAIIKSLALQGAGVIIAIAIPELIFQAYGGSFIKWSWGHLYENIHSNYLKEPFPFIPFVNLRILFAITPATIAAFVCGILLYKSWWKGISAEGRSLLISVSIVMVIMPFLPSTPLLRIIFPFLFAMQACIILMVLNMDRKAIRNIFIAVLLLEMLASLPSTLFIKSYDDQYKSPVMRFENEVLIVDYFGY